ncbi:MAG: flagellar basal body-associated FliL family protein [candidate division Zixibacteria bacterium]|nr:flagellar basal body-associated FliL family protein [candidate division Zixibacteria bacterium]
MADIDKTVVTTETVEEKKPSRLIGLVKKYGIYAGVVVAIIVAAYFVTLKVVVPMASRGPATTEAAPEKVAEELALEQTEEAGDSSSAGEKEPSEGEKKQSGNICMIGEIIVNPAGTGGTRYLSASVGFELGNSKAGARFAEREAVIRDALITILSSQSITELTDFRQRELLRKLIKQRAEKLLKAGDITAVYFTEFVLQ